MKLLAFMEFLKSNFLKIIKTIWLILLLYICGLYIKTNYNRMITGMIHLDYIIILLSIVLVLMPLVSEMDLWGFKVKREMQRVEKELNREIINFQRQMLNIQNSNSQNINFGYSPLPSKEEVNSDNNSVDSKEEEEKENTKLLFFVKTRNALDKEMKRIVSLSNESNYNPISCLNLIEKYRLIDIVDLDKIHSIRIMCNRAVHGEIVSDDYYKFAKDNFPEIINKLKKVKLPDEFWVR